MNLTSSPLSALRPELTAAELSVAALLGIDLDIPVTAIPPLAVMLSVGELRERLPDLSYVTLWLETARKPAGCVSGGAWKDAHHFHYLHVEAAGNGVRLHAPGLDVVVTGTAGLNGAAISDPRWTLTTATAAPFIWRAPTRWNMTAVVASLQASDEARAVAYAAGLSDLWNRAVGKEFIALAYAALLRNE